MLGTLPLIPPPDGAPPDQPPPDDDPEDNHPGSDRPGDGGPGSDGSVDGDAGPGGPRDGSPRDGDPGEDAPADGEPRDDVPPPRDEDAPPDDGLDDNADEDQDEGWDPAEEDDDPCGTRPVPAWPDLGGIPPALARHPAEPDGRPVPGLLDATLPWATLAGLADRPGTLGRIGAITAAQARQLTRAAETDPAAQWRVIVTNSAGQALAVTRIRRPSHRPRDGVASARDGPPGAGLVGRVTVTITQDMITAQQARGPGPPGGTDPPGPLSPVAAAALRAGARALDQARARAAADRRVAGLPAPAAAARARDRPGRDLPQPGLRPARLARGPRPHPGLRRRRPDVPVQHRRRLPQ